MHTRVSIGAGFLLLTPDPGPGRRGMGWKGCRARVCGAGPGRRARRRWAWARSLPSYPRSPGPGSGAQRPKHSQHAGPREAPREARSARLPRLLAPENKGAAPRASSVGPGWSSERRSQSGCGAALGMARPSSQSQACACPSCPVSGGAPGAQCPGLPGWQFPLTLASKSKVFILSPPSKSL